MDLYSLVEFGEFDLLEKRNCLSEGILTRFDLLERSLIFFSGFSCHISSLVLTAASLSLRQRAHLPLSFWVCSDSNTNEKPAQLWGCAT